MLYETLRSAFFAPSDVRSAQLEDVSGNFSGHIALEDAEVGRESFRSDPELLRFVWCCGKNASDNLM